MKHLNKVLILTLAIAAVALTGCTASSHTESTQPSDSAGTANAKAVQYTCSMHPEVVQDKPGDCPKCGMKLVEKK